MAKSTSTMKSFMDVLAQYKNDTTTSGIAILDHAVRAVSRFNSLQDAIDAFVDDVTDERKGNLDKRLLDACGIKTGEDDDFTVDTGAVSGKNAGGGPLKNAEDIVPEPKGSSLSTADMPAAGKLTDHSYTTADGQTFKFQIQWPNSFTQAIDRQWQPFPDYDEDKCTTVDLEDDQIYYSDQKHTRQFTGEQLKKSIETITKGMYKWWAVESAKLAYDSYGVDFNGKILQVKFLVNQENLQAVTAPEDKQINDTTPAKVISMTISLPMYGIIDPDNVNGKTRGIAGGSNQCFLDRTIAHEMIHAVMQGNGTLKSYDKDKGVGMPEFFTEGIAELVMGLDDYDASNTGEIERLAEDREALEEAMVMESGTGTDERYTAGYMFLRYLCKQGLKIPSAVADVIGVEYYDEDGQKLQGASGAVITIDAHDDTKKVTIDVDDDVEVDEGVRIDLTSAQVNVSDETGDVIFTLSGTRISGGEFSVNRDIVTGTGKLLKVWEGNITTSDTKGNFQLESDGNIATTFDEGETTINGVSFYTKAVGGPSSGSGGDL